MNEKLTLRQLTLIGSMLFGMFFGAGNLIFPLILGIFPPAAGAMPMVKLAAAQRGMANRGPMVR